MRAVCLLALAALVASLLPSVAVAGTTSLSFVGCLGLKPHPSMTPDSEMLNEIEGKTFISPYNDGTKEDATLYSLTLSLKTGEYKRVDMNSNVFYGKLEWHRNNYFVLSDLPYGVFGARHGLMALIPSYVNKDQIVFRTCRISWFIFREDLSYYFTSKTSEIRASMKACKGFKTYYSGIIMAGGYGDCTDPCPVQISDIETIDTPALPDLPYPVAGSTLSIIGTKLFTCGGKVNKTLTLNSCHSLDLSDTSATWMKLRNDLPTGGLAFHTATVVGSNLWIVFENVVHVLNTHTDEITTHDPHFKAGKRFCAVSNETHIYIIGAGLGKDEIWMNSDVSNPSNWTKIMTLESKKEKHGCLWMGNSIYTTGGHKYLKVANIFDTNTHEMKNIGDLVTGRHFHAMLELDGRPAVLAGSGSDAKLFDIETYDVEADKWEVSTQTVKKGRTAFGFVQQPQY